MTSDDQEVIQSVLKVMAVSLNPKYSQGNRYKRVNVVLFECLLG